MHARGVRACTHGTELTVWEGCHKTNMVQKMAVRFLQLCHSVAGCGVIGPCTQGACVRARTQGWGVGLKLE